MTGIKWVVLKDGNNYGAVRVVAKVNYTKESVWFTVEGRVVSYFLGVKLKHDFLFWQEEISSEEQVMWFADNAERFAENALVFFLEAALKSLFGDISEIIEYFGVYSDGDILQLGWAGEFAWAVRTFLRVFPKTDVLASAIDVLIISPFEFNRVYSVEYLAKFAEEVHARQLPSAEAGGFLQA